MQSAAATVPWGVITKEESLLRGLRLAELMKCPHDKKNIRAAIDCLRKANTTQLVYKEWDGITAGLTIGIFTPIIDGSFLDEKPAVSLKKKQFKKTNILIGANKDEGFFFIFYYLSEMFKRQEDVFINREDFERSITELNVYANPLQRKEIDQALNKAVLIFSKKIIHRRMIKWEDKRTRVASFIYFYSNG